MDTDRQAWGGDAGDRELLEIKFPMQGDNPTASTRRVAQLA